jgi:hypothetical protein
MPASQNPGPGLSREKGDTTTSPPAAAERGDNSASTVVEAPQGSARSPLDAHDFPSGGGSGGAQAFSRKTLTLKKKKAPKDA